MQPLGVPGRLVRRVALAARVDAKPAPFWAVSAHLSVRPWRNREQGVSKFKIREMGSRYMFIILYCFLEKLLSRGDYRDQQASYEQQLQVWPR